MIMPQCINREFLQQKTERPFKQMKNQNSGSINGEDTSDREMNTLY